MDPRTDSLANKFITSLLFPLFTLSGILASIYFNIHNLVALLLVTLVLMGFQPVFLKKWLTAIIKMTPLFISILILDILLDIGFLKSFHLILKIIFILLISVIIVNQINYKFNVNLKDPGKKKSGKLTVFFITFFQYINILINELTDPSSKQGIFAILSDSIEKKQEYLSGKSTGDHLTEKEKGLLSEYPINPIFLIILLIIIITLFWFEL